MARKEKTAAPQTETIVLLDTHAILHRAYHALPDFTSPTGEPTGALFGVVSMVFKIIEELKPDHIMACFDLPEPTYRHTAYTDYKAGRAKTDDALVAQITRSRDLLAVLGIPIYEAPGFEADDMLGTIVETLRPHPEYRIIIASGDMDTLQLVSGEQVCVYTLKKGIKDTILYTEDAVRARFGFGPELIPDYKGLRGDPSDNIPGIKGIGEKGATTLITNFGSLEKIYETLKKSPDKVRAAGVSPRLQGLLEAGEEEAQFSKMLATIRRDAPITVTIPTAPWRDLVQLEPALTLFAELGFRTHGARLKALLGHTEESESVPPTAPAEEIEDATLALWLLNSDVTNPTYEDILQYGRAEGCRDFADIVQHLNAGLDRYGLRNLYETVEKPLRPVLRAMEARGILINRPYLETLSGGMHAELQERESTIHTLAGTEFNINSPRQLGDVLYDRLGLGGSHHKRTATGQRSTKESELEKLRDEHPIIGEILRYREVQKLVSTYVDTIPTLLAPDGRLHTTFLQAGTTTGRMSSRDPNIQNIPIRTDEGRAIRRAFIASPGFTLVAIDYSQIELRIAAFLSHDPRLIEIFKNGEDVHQGVAARVFGVVPAAVTPEMRRQAKVINFGILYGMGVNALRANLGSATTRAEAQQFLDAYFNTFTKLADYLEATKATASALGYTTTHFGRRRYFPSLQSPLPYLRAQAERMAINAPIQGTAADIIRIAMVTIAERLETAGQSDRVRMLLQVHDELIFEVETTLLAEVVPALCTDMETVLSREEMLGVPLLVSAKTGPNWEDILPYQREAV
jgi:DNA polymerase-1